MLVCLNSFVMNVVSLAVYVMVAHFLLLVVSPVVMVGGGRISVGVSERSCCVGCFGEHSLHVGILQCVIGRRLDGCIEM